MALAVTMLVQLVSVTAAFREENIAPAIGSDVEAATLLVQTTDSLRFDDT